MANIPIGTQGVEKRLVTTENAISFLENEGARVLSTPHMIGLMEWTCRNTVKPLLEEGFDTVGTHVNVAHLGAAPIGMMVTFTAEVLAVEGRRVTFKVTADDEKGKIGEGTHERAIINVAKFAAKMAEKLAAS
ncbi:MAG TPA: thioesterase family protein [Candidatus Acidoferrum sp.]|nr:thioesterase family protein [Candidatus Acidoferrum sp.]